MPIVFSYDNKRIYIHKAGLQEIGSSASANEVGMLLRARSNRAAARPQ